MSDFVGAALNTADLVTKVTGIAVDFMTSIGCEGFCELFDFGKSILFEAIKSGRLDYQTRKALDDLDPRIVDDLKCFVGQQLKKYSKKGKLPKKLKGKDLVDVFMNRLDTVSKLVDDYAEQNNVSEEQRIALKYILNEIRQCTAQASLLMLNAEDKRFALVISQIVRNTFEDYREDFSSNLSGALFRPTHCCYCASPNLILDDSHGVATCKNCGTKTEYQYREQTNFLEEAKEAFKAEFEQINAQFEQVYGIHLEILRAVNSLKLDTDLKSRLSIAQDHILNYEFPEAVNACEGILGDYPDSIDALWCYLQASYGIVYLRGYNDKIAKPTFCYAQDPRSRKRFCKDPYYEKILELLANDPERMQIYKDRQRDIDAAIEKFKTDLRQGNEYDVFICVKIGLATKSNPDPNPNLVTEDYEKYADVIYDELTRMGLRPYCSKRNAPRGIGSDAQIWSAMLRSKKILIIGTSKEYLTSVWVKCEWRRWLCLIEKLKCREETTFIPWIPVENWVDQQPEEWNPYKPQICQTQEQVIKAIVGEPTTAQPIDDSRAIRDVRALLDRNKIAQAKQRLKLALDENPSSGELMLLNLRIKSNNFKNLKKITPHDIEVACRYLSEDKDNNPEYRMYIEKLNAFDSSSPKILKESSAKSKKRSRVQNSKKRVRVPWKAIGWTLGILVVLAVVWGVAVNIFKLEDTFVMQIIVILIGSACIGFAVGVIQLMREENSYQYIPVLLWIIGIIIAACLLLACIYPTAFLLLGILITAVSTVSLCVIFHYAKGRSKKSIRISNVLLIIGGIIAIIIMICIALHPYGLNSLGLKYTMDENLEGYVVSRGFDWITELQEDIVIPDQYKGVPVVAIDSETFSDKWRLRTVVIPDTIQRIGFAAFRNCKHLKDAYIGSGVVSIGSDAFDSCYSLAAIDLPDSMEYIGQGAFSGCQALSTISIPEGVTDIEPYVFSGCSNLVSVTFPSTLKRIDENAFNENNKVTELNYNGFKENWAEIDKGQWWNQYLLTNTITCLDGEIVIYSIRWNLNGGESDYEYPTEYIYGKGIPATQFPTPTYEGMLFCGWQMNGKYVTSIDSSVNGNVTLDAVWVKSSYSISGASRSERSTSKEFSYHYELVGHIRIPDELRDMIARGKVKLIIRGEISVSVQSQGDATATASTWLVITPNAALGDRNIDTEKCSQSAKGGGYTSGFLGLGKEPKDGNKLSNTIEFSTTVPIIGYASEIPVYSYMEYNSNKENDEVNISIWSSLNELTYEFVVK